MTEVKTTVNRKDEEGKIVFSEEVTVDYDFGETLAETSEKFGEKITHQAAEANLKVALQGAIRRFAASKDADTGEFSLRTSEEIAQDINDWKPGETSRGKSKLEKLEEAFGSMTEEQQADFKNFLSSVQ